MQWDNSVNAGFSCAPASYLYIKQDDSPDRPTVEKMDKDPDSLLNEIRKLTKIRMEHAALSNMGEISFVTKGANGEPLIYLRSYGDEKVFVAVNPNEKEFEIEVCLDSDVNAKEIIYSFGGKSSMENNILKISAKSSVFISLS